MSAGFCCWLVAFDEGFAAPVAAGFTALAGAAGFDWGFGEACWVLAEAAFRLSTTFCANSEGMSNAAKIANTNFGPRRDVIFLLIFMKSLI